MTYLHAPRGSRAAVLAPLALVAVVGLSACGADEGGSSPSSSRTAANGDVFGTADVRFATDMVPHHAQALELVTLTDGRQLDPAVRALADEIREAQAPEVEQMSDWLVAWDQPVPATSLDHVHGHSSDATEDSDTGADTEADTEADMDMDMPGMVSATDLDALADLPDEEFQARWLELMEAHHEGAVAMARTEQEDGAYAGALALAGSIIETQQAEIATIHELAQDD